MTVGIRGLSSSLIHNMTQLAPYLSPSRGAARFVPNVAELSLGGILGLAYLHQRGRAMREHDTTNDNRWLYAMGEGVTSQAIIQNIKLGMPGLGLAWTAYEMGMVKGQKEKLKTALKGAVLFPLGYIGLLMGLGITDGLRHSDAKAVGALLAKFEKQLATAKPKTSLREAAMRLNTPLKLLKARINGLTSLYKGPMPQLVKVPQATAVYMEAQQAFLAQCEKLMPRQMAALGKTGQELLGHLRYSSVYNIVRLLNPAFGYLLAVTFVGLPIVQLITNWALPKAAHQDARTIGHNVAPLWFDRMLGWVTGAGGGHGTGGGEMHINPYLRGDGPALINAAWENSQPHSGGAGH